MGRLGPFLPQALPNDSLRRSTKPIRAGYGLLRKMFLGTEFFAGKGSDGWLIAFLTLLRKATYQLN